MKLTYEEYESISVNPVDVTKFDALSTRAIQIIDIYTRYYYSFVAFETDHDWRKAQVKAAIAFQVDYFSEMGKTSYEGINSAPTSVSLGRTSITQSSRRVSESSVNKSMLAYEAQLALSGTGLLTRGVG